MARLSIVLVFLFVLFIQFNTHETTRVYETPAEELEEPLYPSPISSSLLNLWYKRLNEREDNDAANYPERVWKRLAPAEFYHFRQRRRFGNTRYGRSLAL